MKNQAGSPTSKTATVWQGECPPWAVLRPRMRRTGTSLWMIQLLQAPHKAQVLHFTTVLSLDLTDEPVLLPMFSLICLRPVISEHQEFIFCPGSEISIAAAVPVYGILHSFPRHSTSILLHLTVQNFNTCKNDHHISGPYQVDLCLTHTQGKVTAPIQKPKKDKSGLWQTLFHLALQNNQGNIIIRVK